MRHILLAAVVAAAPAVPALSPPVDAPVSRAFQAPAGEYGPGHRGIDFDVPPGTPVRAAADGTVVFAGSVAGARHVVLAHPGALRTSYSFLADVRVSTGMAVRRGSAVGTSGGEGAGHSRGTVHFGVRRAGRYVDPLPLLGRRPPRIRLAPLERSRSARCPPEAGHYTGAAPATGRELTRPQLHR